MVSFRWQRPKAAQVDLLSSPRRPHRRQRRRATDMRISSAKRVGLTTFRTARMKQQVMKVPKDEVVIALVLPKAAVLGGLENDLAVDQECEQFDSGKVRSRASCLIDRGADIAAMAAAIAGLQILNNAAARGRSRTISLPRRRI